MSKSRNFISFESISSTDSDTWHTSCEHFGFSLKNYKLQFAVIRLPNRCDLIKMTLINLQNSAANGNEKTNRKFGFETHIRDNKLADSWSQFEFFAFVCDILSRVQTSHFVHSHCWSERSHDPPMCASQSTQRAHIQPTRHKNRNKSLRLRQYLAIKQIKLQLKRFLRSICEMRVPSLTGSISCVSYLWKQADIILLYCINRLRKEDENHTLIQHVKMNNNRKECTLPAADIFCCVVSSLTSPIV